MQQVAAIGSGERARDVILTVVPHLSVPTNNLFKIQPAPTAQFLVETDPRFTDGKAFLSSDYFLQQLQLDPERTMKRYGDGFEEQQLVNDQVLTLTGRRYLSGYASTQDEYAALMDAGVAYAKQYQLAPGVALSAAQMALLTTDIVWLTSEDVTLADGSVQHVIVPEVYLRRPQDADLSTSGALIAGGTVSITTAGNLVNSGTIQGDQLDLHAGNDIVNSGTLRGQTVLAHADRDLNDLGGSILGTGTDSTITLGAGRDILLQTTTQTSANDQSTRTNVDRVAVVQGGNITFDAARDFLANGATVAAGQDLQVTATGQLQIAAVQSSLTLDADNLKGPTNSQGKTAYFHESSTSQQSSSFTAGGNAVLIAQGNLGVNGSDLSAAGDLHVQGANVDIAAAKATSSTDMQTVQAHGWDHGIGYDETLVGGAIKAGHDLTVVATAGNTTLTGASLEATTGRAAVAATGDVTVQAAILAHGVDTSSYDAQRSGIGGLVSMDSQSQSDHAHQSTELAGSSIRGDSVLIQAGNADQQTGDVKLLGSTVTANGAAIINAGRDVLVSSMDQTSGHSDQEQSASGWRVGPKILESATAAITKATLAVDPVAEKYVPGPATHNTTTEAGNALQTTTQAVASAISAGSLDVEAGRDATIKGSAIVTTDDLTIHAARDLSLITSHGQQSATQSHSKLEEGLYTSTGLNIGTREVRQGDDGSGATAVASQLASLDGNVDLSAGGAYRQSGSQVLALGKANVDGASIGGDITISAKSVAIDPGHNTGADHQTSNSHQEGIAIGVAGPIAGLVSSVQQSAASASKTDDSRFQALAAATAAMNAYSTLSAAASATGPSDVVGISVDLVHSQSRSASDQKTDSAQASTVSAARDLHITATGDGSASTITVTGSDLTAGHNASLKADGTIDLQAAASTSQLVASNSSQSSNLGITLGGGAQNGLSFQAGASVAGGTANGADLTYRNTHVAAGNAVQIDSGGDLNLKGAAVAGNSVTANVGGNLNVQSLQDSSKYSAQQTSGGVSVSICVWPICYGETVEVSASFAAAKAKGDFLGVVEQSGIKAGDGGFQVNAVGNTDLKGGVIVSSQNAIDANANRFTTATLTTSAIQNQDSHSAAAVAGSYSTGSGDGGNGNAKGGMAGASFTNGQQSTTTTSAISAGQLAITDDAKQQALTGKDGATTLANLDTKATTDSDTAGTIQKAWDGQKLLDQAQANAQIAGAFGSSAAKTIGTYADSKTKPYVDAANYAQLKAVESSGQTLTDGQAQAVASYEKAGLTPDKAAATLNDPNTRADYDNWKEGGAYRVAAHTGAGLLAGGIEGAIGAGTVAAAAPTLNALIDQQDLPAPVKQLLGTAAAAAIGAVASGGSIQGTGAAVNTDLNNRQLHPG